MRKRTIHRVALLAALCCGGLLAPQVMGAPNEKKGPDDPGGKKPKTVFDFKVKGMDGKDVDLSKFRGQVLMVVNVASQ